MKILINGSIYENITWNGTGFSVESNMTLSEAESLFTPGLNTNIILYDNTQEIGRYYNKGISSLTVSGASPRIIHVEFNLTQINTNVEEEIRSNMEFSDGAIIELAEMINNLYEQIDLISNFNNRVYEIEINIQDINKALQSIINRLNILEEHHEGED